MLYNCLRDIQRKKCRPKIEMSMTGMKFTDFKRIIALNYVILLFLFFLRSGYF